MGGDSHPESEFWPQNIWPWVKNVIVLGIPLYSPMMSTTPSTGVYRELYDTSNRVLDDMAYRLTNYIVNRLGYKAIFFPRDCYNIDVLVDNPNMTFFLLVAGYYAGMGTIGDSHNLITKEFEFRLRIVYHG